MLELATKIFLGKYQGEAFTRHEGLKQFWSLGRCPSTVQPVFPVLVFQLSRQQNRTRTTSSPYLEPLRSRTVLGQRNSL